MIATAVTISSLLTDLTPRESGEHAKPPATRYFINLIHRIKGVLMQKTGGHWIWFFYAKVETESTDTVAS
jgi:hypothetical protein